MQTKVFLQKVREMCQKPAEERGLLVWDVTFEKEGPRHMLTVVVDKEGGVDIDDCEYVSRAIDPLLSALIGHGWQGVVVQIIGLALATLVYIPFMIVANKQAEVEQAAQN